MRSGPDGASLEQAHLCLVFAAKKRKCAVIYLLIHDITLFRQPLSAQKYVKAEALPGAAP